GRKTDKPEEREGGDKPVQQVQKEGRRNVAKGEQADQEEDEEEDDGERRHDGRQDRHEYRVEDPAALELVDAQAPTQPEERLEVLPVHDTFSSSQRSLWGTTASAPAFSRKRSSREPPCRIAARDACSTSDPLTMMPTWVQSFSTISSTCDVRKTVDPRATNPASKSRMTREVIASTPSNGSSRNNRSGFGSRAAASASFFFIPWEYSRVSFVSSSASPSNDSSSSDRSRIVSRGIRYIRPTKVRYSRAVRLSKSERFSA